MGARDDRADELFGDLFRDLRTFAEGGGGNWRILQLSLPAISGLAAVRDLVDSGRANERDAVELVIEAAASRLDPPQRDAALAHLGLTEVARKVKSRTARENLAADILHMDGRTYRRTETPRDERSDSYSDQILWMVVDQLALDGPPDGRKRILYVEDDPVFVGLVRDALPDYVVEEADALGKALAILESRSRDFSLVLVDANLTDLDDRAGYEVLEYIQERCPELPRILVTASRLAGPVTRDFINRYGLSELLLKDERMVPGLRASVAAALDDRK